MRRRGFTLIELLIVVAIIAILAAIAVPNFLEAQTRAKVSRVKADMRSAATALEAYRIDWNVYPYCGYNYDGSGAHPYNYWFLPQELSTPQAYMTSVKLIDPFRQERYSTSHWQLGDIRYISTQGTWGTSFDGIQVSASQGLSGYYDEVLQEWGGWRLNSAGPDMFYGPPNSIWGYDIAWPGISGYPQCPMPYDATNGTVSWGDVQRSQVATTGYVNAQ
jgi:prepilin-type N-terminal cleavage/methylation domain-containing protein